MSKRALQRNAKVCVLFGLACLLSVAWTQYVQEMLDSDLSESVIHGNIAHCVSLLKQGGNPNVSIVVGTHDLRRHSFFEFLKSYFVPANRQDRSTPLLIEAVRQTNGEDVIVDALVNAGAKVNVRDQDGETPLIIAMEERKLRIATVLIGRGADVNSYDKQGRTPLISAVCSAPYRGGLDVINILIDHGANVNTPDSDGVTPLMFAVERKPDIVRMLCAKGANINAIDQRGHTALAIAEWARASSSISLLRSSGATN